MIISPYMENEMRGTPDFPIGLYNLYETHPRYKMQLHWHGDIEIIRVLSGTLHLFLNSNEKTLSKGDCILLPGGVSHAANPEKCKYDCLVFSPSILYVTQSTKSRIKQELKFPTFITDKESCDKLFESIANSNRNDIDTLIYLFKVVKNSIDNQQKSDIHSTFENENLKKAITFIEDNFAEQISLSDISNSCGMTPNYFCRFFKEKTSQSPIEYLTTYRIETACEMLLLGNNVTQTAFSCGFNDLSYFISVFKRQIGMSPKKYAEFYEKEK